MGQFVDHSDLRKLTEIPRISHRYRAETEAVWFPPSRRRLVDGRPQPVKVQVVDLSVAGALLAAPTNKALQMGAKVRIQFDGIRGVAVIHNIRASSTPTHSYFGVAFFLMSHELEVRIMQLIAENKAAR